LRIYLSINKQKKNNNEIVEYNFFHLSLKLSPVTGILVLRAWSWRSVATNKH